MNTCTLIGTGDEIEEVNLVEFRLLFEGTHCPHVAVLPRNTLFVGCFIPNFVNCGV